MPRRCCIPECNSNNSKPYISVFRIPKDEEIRKKWLRKIPRDFVPTNDSVVCIKHFLEECIIRNDTATRPDGSVLTLPRKNPVLSKDAYPTIFPGLPSYLTKEPSAKRKSPNDRHEALDIRDQRNFDEWLAKDKITLFSDLCVQGVNRLQPGDWIFVKNPEKCAYCLFNDLQPCPSISISITVDKDLKISVFKKMARVKDSKFKFILGDNEKLDSWSKLECLLSYCKGMLHDSETEMERVVGTLSQLSDDIECLKQHEGDNSKCTKFEFLLDQMKLLTFTTPRYTPACLLWAFQIFIMSSSLYNTLRDTALTLPHTKYLSKLSCGFKVSSGTNSETHANYLKSKADLLNEHEKLITLMMDEIHVKPQMSYKAGNIVGRALNNSEEQATTVQAFMLRSILSKNRDIVALFPVKNMTASYLLQITQSVLEMVKQCGYHVVALISDNNRINRNMFTAMCGGTLKPYIKNPWDPSDPLFFLFDTVHLLKCIRNNWLNQADSEKTFLCPHFSEENKVQKASFDHLRKVYVTEKDNIVKLAPTLSYKVLFPTNLERQNVMLAVRVFDERNILALEHFSKNLNGSPADTGNFILTILKLWKIFNIQHQFKGRNTRDVNSDPFRSVTDPRLQFLKDVVVWLEKWEEMNLPQRQGVLSRETMFSLKHTVKTLGDLIVYLLTDMKFAYVLTAKFQTDNLESRFSQYRRMSGANYNVSLRHILESEKKLKLISMLNLQSVSKGKLTLSHLLLRDEDIAAKENGPLTENLELLLPVLEVCDEINVLKEELQTLVYISGYIVHKCKSIISCALCLLELTTSKPLQCNIEDNEVLRYLSKLDRGGLTWPTEIAVNTVLECFKVFKCIIGSHYEDHFLSLSHHKEALLFLFRQRLAECNFPLSAVCDCGLLNESLLSKITSSIANIFLNNFCKLANDKAVKAIASKRKMSTLAAPKT